MKMWKSRTRPENLSEEVYMTEAAFMLQNYNMSYLWTAIRS